LFIDTKPQSSQNPRYDQSIAAIYIILLALLNDITMIMVAYDNVKPSRSVRADQRANA